MCAAEDEPLLLAGIFYKQFMIIYPFMGSNGRTTRLATKVLLVQMRVDASNLLSFENYYDQNVARYSERVGGGRSIYNQDEGRMIAVQQDAGRICRRPLLLCFWYRYIFENLRIIIIDW